MYICARISHKIQALSECTIADRSLTMPFLNPVSQSFARRSLLVFQTTANQSVSIHKHKIKKTTKPCAHPTHQITHKTVHNTLKISLVL